MPQQPIRVLIVDDEDRFRETTAAILRRRGFAVTAVGSGTEALEQVRRDDIDVVVLDVKMPGMDGHEALREIRKIKPGLAVIMLTGHGTPGSALEGLRDGVFDYLTKPCAVDLLAQKIREAHAGADRGEDGLRAREPRVRDVMIPLESFSTVRESQTVAEAIEAILASFSHSRTTSTVQETIHRSALVLDAAGKVVGILTFSDLLRGLLPGYMHLLQERPSMAHSITLEAPHFSGMFTIMARDLAGRKVADIMSESPPIIRADATLMQAVDLLLKHKLRRLLVIEADNVIGVIREQDLVFAMIGITREADSAGTV